MRQFAIFSAYSRKWVKILETFLYFNGHCVDFVFFPFFRLFLGNYGTLSRLKLNNEKQKVSKKLIVEISFFSLKASSLNIV